MGIQGPLNKIDFDLLSLARRAGELRELLLHLRRGRVAHRRAVAEQQGGDGLVADVDPHHELGRRRVELDVDLGDLDPGPAELALEVLAETAPGGRVHRERHGGLLVVPGPADCLAGGLRVFATTFTAAAFPRWPAFAGPDTAR